MTDEKGDDAMNGKRKRVFSEEECVANLDDAPDMKKVRSDLKEGLDIATIQKILTEAAKNTNAQCSPPNQLVPFKTGDIWREFTSIMALDGYANKTPSPHDARVMKNIGINCLDLTLKALKIAKGNELVATYYGCVMFVTTSKKAANAILQMNAFNLEVNKKKIKFCSYDDAKMGEVCSIWTNSKTMNSEQVLEHLKGYLHNIVELDYEWNAFGNLNGNPDGLPHKTNGKFFDYHVNAHDIDEISKLCYAGKLIIPTIDGVSMSVKVFAKSPIKLNFTTAEMKKMAAEIGKCYDPKRGMRSTEDQWKLKISRNTKTVQMRMSRLKVGDEEKMLDSDSE